MQPYYNSVQDAQGNAVAGASVTIYLKGTSTKASLFSDNGTTVLANPVISDGLGQIALYAANARYSATTSKIGITTQTIPDFILFDPADAGAIASSSVTFTPSGIGAVQRDVQGKLRERVSVFDFMTAAQIADVQAGTLLVDVSAAIQAAIDAVKAGVAWVNNGSKGVLYFPPGHYLVTKSLNCTSNNSAGHGYTVRGENLLNTIIDCKLTEAYPVFDFAGNGFSRLAEISVRQQSGCLATVGLLHGYVGSDTVGMQGMTSDAFFHMLTCPGIVNTTDQHTFNKVEAHGTYGCVSGCGNALSITSKYVTIFHVADSTRTYFHDCNFQGGVPLFLTGCKEYNINYMYCAPTYATSPAAVNAAIVMDDSYTSQGGSSLKARGVRVENQTASGTQNAIHTIAILKQGSVQNTAIQVLDVEGAFEPTNASGANANSSIIHSDVNSFITDLRLKGSTTFNTYPILHLLGSTPLNVSVGSLDVDMPLSTNIGTLAHKTAGKVRVAGGFALTDIAALSSSNPVGEMRNGTSYGAAYDHVSDWAVIPNVPGVTAAQAAVVTIPITVNVTYTGGSGPQAFLTLSVPAGFYPTSGRTTRHLEFLVVGNISAACTFNVTYSDGTNTLTSDTFTSGTGKYSLRIHARMTGSSNIEGYMEVNQTGQFPLVWLGNTTTVLPTAAYTIKLNVTSVSNNPLSFYADIKGLWS